MCEPTVTLSLAEDIKACADLSYTIVDDDTVDFTVTIDQDAIAKLLIEFRFEEEFYEADTDQVKVVWTQKEAPTAPLAVEPTQKENPF